MEKLFFDASKQAFNQVSNIYDFVWPTSAALWNLRWQVKGFVDINPSTTAEELEGRFVSGSKIHGTNIKRAFIENTWDQQQEEFAKFLLVNVCALYEAWISSLLKAIAITNHDYEKQLQFPTYTLQSGKTKGIWTVIKEVTSNESDILKNAFYVELCKNRKNLKDKLDNLLICYRYFKECRNCILHNSGIADEKSEIAYQQFLAIATPSHLGIKEIPNHLPIETGKLVRISLRGVVGFSDIVLRIVATVDAEFSRSVHAEHELLKRWKNKKPKQIQLRSDDNFRRRQIVRHMQSLSFPSPSRTDQLEKFLQDKVLTDSTSLIQVNIESAAIKA